MTKRYKFNLKKFCLLFVATAFCIAITWNSEARHTNIREIYSTLTNDTIPLKKKDSVAISNVNDSLKLKDTIKPIIKVDSFSLKLSKDTLDGPVNYEAADSGVLRIKEKKFYLYGKTKTTYKDIVLTAPSVAFNQETNILSAFSSKDSLGNIIARAKFQQGTQGFQSDTIEFNFKTQKGLTKNTFTKQQEMFVQAQLLKKTDSNTTFAKHVIMTTCDYDEPHFGFVASKGKFINNKMVITGPIHPEFEGVPIPIYLPFGIFPLQKGRHSGLLPPQFTANEQFGIGLEGLGYYHVLNDNLDVTLRTNIYSYGGWTANLIPTYRKRYRYNGAFNIGIQRTKFNFKGDPDFQLIKTFQISWNHSVDPKATPGTIFSANVNAGSTKYNQYLPNQPNRNFQNQLTSSISYAKTWAGKPYNLTLSANHNQNNQTHEIHVILPDAGFNVTTIYPFQKKDQIGTPKWYEKIGVGYTGIARNQIVFVDTAKNTIKKLLDTLQWGAQHRFPISVSLPPVGPLIISPFISYEETWLTNRVKRQWNDSAKKVDTIYDKKGLFIDRQLSFGIGINTAIYGTKVFKHSTGLLAIRHVMRPNLNFNYKPNLSKKYYDVIQADSTGHKGIFPQFVGGSNLFTGYGYGRFGGATFGIDNNLEMKWKGKKDTSEQGKKVKLIDGFGFTSGYNFLQDSLKLLPFNLYLRTTLFEKISITAQGLYDPYQQDSSGVDISRFVWQGDRFRLGRLRSGSIAMSTSFQSKPRDPKQAANVIPNRQINDPNLLADEERLKDYIRKNPAEFVDFNIPWQVTLSYSLYFSRQLIAPAKYKTTVTSNISFTSSFSLTPKWNFTTNGYYDFNTNRLTLFTMSISRDMHCWQMSIGVTPVGQPRSFNFTISPKSSILQDLKVNRSRYFYNY